MEMTAAKPRGSKPKILYITAAHNPYRDAFFEQLGTKCDLTVVFESGRNPNRPSSWYEDARTDGYSEIYLPEREDSIVSKTLLDICVRGWDLIVVGCVNIKHQICSILYMRLRRIPYIINLDGPLFDSNGLRGFVRKFILRDAAAYLVAGFRSVGSVEKEIGRNAKIVPYPFTSLSSQELNERRCAKHARGNTVLVVSRFAHCKGMDVAADALVGFGGSFKVKIVGVGDNADDVRLLFNQKGISNVEVISFLTSEELTKEYERALCLLLPSRQECWGLVVNEAAACGCPIVSTWGSGAAVEFLAQDYPELLASPGDSASLRKSLECFLAFDKCEKGIYSDYLRNKAQNYSIEAEVTAHSVLFDELIQEKLSD